MDCGGKGRVATDIATYECSIYRVKNERDVVIGPRLQPTRVLAAEVYYFRGADGAVSDKPTPLPQSAPPLIDISQK